MNMLLAYNLIALHDDLGYRSVDHASLHGPLKRVLKAFTPIESGARSMQGRKSGTFLGNNEQSRSVQNKP